MFKYETHLHTSSCSACALSSGLEMVDAALQKGYAGFFITNHFYEASLFFIMHYTFNTSISFSSRTAFNSSLSKTAI